MSGDQVLRYRLRLTPPAMRQFCALLRARMPICAIRAAFEPQDGAAYAVSILVPLRHDCAETYVISHIAPGLQPRYARPTVLR